MAKSKRKNRKPISRPRRRGRQVKLGSTPDEHLQRARTMFDYSLQSSERSERDVRAGYCRTATISLLDATNNYGEGIAHMESGGTLAYEKKPGYTLLATPAHKALQKAKAAVLANCVGSDRNE